MPPVLTTQIYPKQITLKLRVNNHLKSHSHLFLSAHLRTLQSLCTDCLLIWQIERRPACLTHKEVGLLGHKIHHLLYVSSLTLLKTAANERKVTIPPYKKQTLMALAVWKLAGLPRVNHQNLKLRALPPPSPSLQQSREEAGGRGERTLFRPKGPF